MSTSAIAPVRLAERSDAEAISRLSAQLGYADTELATVQARLQALLSSEQDYIWVFEREGELLGWVHAFAAQRLASAAFLELGGLVVDERTRRAGVGRALVQQARDQAVALGFELRVRCNAKRTDSHAFYRSIGFQQQKEQHVFSV